MKSHTRRKIFSSLLTLLLLALAPAAWATTYYSQGSGDATTLGNWNSVAGGGGSAPADFITSGDIFVITNGNSMTTAGTWTLASGVTVEIANGGTLTATAQIASLGTFKINANGTYIHNWAGTGTTGLITDFPGTTRTLDPASTVEIQAWGGTQGGTIVALANPVNWGNLTINMALQNATWSQSGKLTNVMGNLTLKATGLIVTNNFSLGTTAYTLTIGGDLIILGANGPKFFITGNGGTPSSTIKLYGNYNQSGGSFSANSAGTNVQTLIFDSNSGASPTATFTKTSGSMSGLGLANITVGAGKTLTLNNNFDTANTINPTLNGMSNRVFTVNGTLNCGAFNVLGQANFVLSSGATLGIGSVNGISSALATGNIQVTNTSGSSIASYSSTANYIYNGSAAQVTGSALPATVTNLTINNATGVSLSQNATLTGALTLTSGQLTTSSGNLLTLGSAATISGASASSFVNGPLARVYSATGSKSFPIGLNSNYRAVTLNMTTLSGTPTITITPHEPGTFGGTTPGGTTLFTTRDWTVASTVASGNICTLTVDGTDFSPANSAVLVDWDGTSTTSLPASFSSPNYTSAGIALTASSDFALGDFGCTPPSAPGQPSVSAGCNLATVTWSPVGGATSYNVYRKLSGGSYGGALAVGASSPYLDNTTVAGSNYVYAVTALTTCESSLSTDSSVVTAIGVPTAAPTIGIVTPSCSSLTVNWGSVAGATSYKVYRRVSSGSYGAVLATVVSPTASYADNTAVAGSNYVYAVTAVNGCGEYTTKSSDSAAATIDAVAITSQPANLTAPDGSATASFTVAATGAGLTYQWQTNNGGGYVSVGSGSGGQTATYTLPTLTPAYHGLLVQCVVSGSCGSPVTSSAATLSVGTYFQSRTSGGLTWSTANTWEYSVDGSTWLTTSAIPTAADTVKIQTGHLIRVSTSSTAKCGSLTIDSGGTLQWNLSATSHRVLFIAGSLTNNGTISDLGTAAPDNLCHVIQFTASGIWAGSGNIAGGFAGVTVDNGATLTLATSDGLTLKPGTALPVIAVNGTLNAGTNVLTLNSGTFTLGSGGTLQTANTNGFYGNDATYTLNENGGAPTLALSGGNISFNGTASQNAAGLTGTVNKLIIANTGAPGNKTVALNSTVTVADQLQINGGLLNPSGTASTANTLSFDNGATLQSSGTWGSTASTAVNQTNTYFAGTGYVTVTSGPKWFRSNGTGGGNWSDNSTWQISTNNGSTYGAASETPTSVVGKIEIRNSDTVTITAASTGVSIDEVTIVANGQLTIAADVVVTLANGDGTNDLVVNGNFLNQGTVTWSGKWALNASATYIHYNTNAAGNNGPFNALNTIDSASTWIYRGSSTVATPLATGGRIYGNLIIESADATAYTPSAASALTLTVNGDFTLGANVTLTNSHTGAWIFDGNFTDNGTIINTGAEIYTFNGIGKTIGGMASPIPFVACNLNGSITLGQNVAASGAVALAGNISLGVNKSSTPTNKTITATGALNHTGGGSITVLPSGPALAAGDKFTIFNQPVVSGGSMTISGALPGGLTWTNNLATDGSISVVSAAVTPPPLGVSKSGNVLTFTWAGTFKLQSQTNALSAGLKTNWFDYPGGGSSPVPVTINPANPAVFFRLSQ